jgi:site-specific DNA recombinase
LHELGIKPRKSKRGVWNTSTLTTLLRNRAYIGEAHWGSSYAVVPERAVKNEKYKKVRKTSRRIKPREEWIASAIPVPAIIDRELFERARQQIQKNSALGRRNRKNEYLLSGKLRCTCGRTRAGEGPQKGKHLYYRCTDRVLSYPLAPTCKERGINARVADKLVWNLLSDLLSSPNLLAQQVERWLKSQKTTTANAPVDIDALKSELQRLKTQEDRYVRAYGVGAFDIEKLKEYTAQIRRKMDGLEGQIANASADAATSRENDPPTTLEIENFTAKVRHALPELSFEAKREIVITVIEKAVASQQELHVYGHIPIASENHVEFKTIHRHGPSFIRHQSSGDGVKSIPFSFDIKLPPPRYERTIVGRDKRGRILHSLPPNPL